MGFMGISYLISYGGGSFTEEITEITEEVTEAQRSKDSCPDNQWQCKDSNFR